VPTIDVLFAAMPVADLDTAVDWYARVLGRPPDMTPNDDEVMWQCSPGGWLYVIHDPQRAGRSTVTVAVADLEAAVAEIAGCDVRGSAIERVGDAGRKANFADPDGNIVSFIEVNAPADG
jgi:glyoxylase I family protein